MNISFRITDDLLTKIHADLSRPHAFAAERVGFIACACASLPDKGLEFLAQTFHPVADDHYIDDPRVGAMMGSAAIRAALQYAYQQPVSMFHVHRHEHRGRPRFSTVDICESARFVPDFWKVRPTRAHGALVLSLDSMFGHCWIPGARAPQSIESFSVVGRPTTTIRGEA